MASTAVQPNASTSQGRATQHDILPTLFGDGYGTYRVERNNFVLSFLTHILAGLLFVVLPMIMIKHPPEMPKAVSIFTGELSDYVFPVGKKIMGGGGGGGESSKIVASKGAPPKLSTEQFTPP